MDKIIALDPLKIRRLDVVRERYFWGPASAEGIMSYTTYKGDLGGLDMDPHAVVLDYEGLQLQREFYSPVYDTEAKGNSSIPDFRNTLYWNPDIRTGESGHLKLNFYTGDRTGSYMGIVEGISPDGETGYRYFYFEVNK